MRSTPLAPSLASGFSQASLSTRRVLTSTVSSPSFVFSPTPSSLRRLPVRQGHTHTHTQTYLYAGVCALIVALLFVEDMKRWPLLTSAAGLVPRVHRFISCTRSDSRYAYTPLDCSAPPPPPPALRRLTFGVERPLCFVAVTEVARRHAHHLMPRRPAPKKRVVRTVRKRARRAVRREGSDAATHSDANWRHEDGAKDVDDLTPAATTENNASGHVRSDRHDEQGEGDDVDIVEEVVLEFPNSPRPSTRVSEFKPAAQQPAQTAFDALWPCGTSSSGARALPPWPVDSIEFNARARYGGHDQRLAAERAARTSQQDDAAPSDAGSARSGGCDTTKASPPVASPPALTMSSAARRARLEEVQRSPSGVAALSTGGWVCAMCFNPTPLASRSVCSQCFTLRHDLAYRSVPSEGRRDAQRETGCEDEHAHKTGGRHWRCRACDEFNSEADVVCRCCRTTRLGRRGTAAVQEKAVRDPVTRTQLLSTLHRSTHEESKRVESGTGDGADLRRVIRRTVAEELKDATPGSVLDVRGRVLRWRCTACTSVNSLQARLCRHCRRERFGIALRCVQCRGTTRLDNATVYGETSSEAAEPARHFHLDNRAPRRAPRLCCAHCRASLHSATVLTLDQLSDHGHLWWCACGMTNKNTRHCCLRCRLPRLIPPTMMKGLMPFLFSETADAGAAITRTVAGERGIDGGWDFQDCTHWYCQSCDGINKASRYVVYEVARDASDGSPRLPASETTRSRRVARMYHGHARCQHCHAPWHHLVLPDGVYWRCACLQVNTVAASPHEAAATASTPTASVDVDEGEVEDEKPMISTMTPSLSSPADHRRPHASTAPIPPGAACLCCGLPPLDNMRPDMLSMWTPGDWYCVACGRHCYRERMSCVCGATRPGAASA